MDGVAISEDQVISIDDIAEGVRGLRIVFVNVFAVTHSDGSWSLIDAALPLSAPHIRSWAEKHFSTPPNALILTHGHFDHVSAANELAEEWKIPIYAHSLEIPYLSGVEEYPEPNVGAGGGMMTLLSPLYPRGPIDVGNRLVPFSDGDDGVIYSGLPKLQDLSEMPGWRVLHTPGHTAGHISLFRPSDRTLLVGDAFCTTKPESFFEAAIAQNPELHGPPSYFTSDWNAARITVQQLASLEPHVLAPGHGKPLAGDDVASSLHKLSADFVEIAVPANEK